MPAYCQSAGCGSGSTAEQYSKTRVSPWGWGQSPNRCRPCSYSFATCACIISPWNDTAEQHPEQVVGLLGVPWHNNARTDRLLRSIRTSSDHQVVCCTALHVPKGLAKLVPHLSGPLQPCRRPCTLATPASRHQHCQNQPSSTTDTPHPQNPLILVQEREATLAALLRQRLVPHETGDAAAFKQAVDREVHELAALPFGIAMLHCIG